MPTPQPARNKRRVRRRPPRPRVSITCYKGSFGLGKNLVESVVDLSEAGLSMFTPESLEVGQAVEVHLESYHIRRPIKAAGDVVWVRTRDTGVYWVGVRFDRTLAFSHLQHFTRL